MHRSTSGKLAFIAALMGAVASAGCSRSQEPVPTGVQSAAVQEPEFAAGDAVVVEASRATFFEATVRRPGKTRMHLDVPDAGAPREVDSPNVYAIAERNSGAALPEGSLAICRPAPLTWVGCRIEGRGEGRLTAAGENGDKFQLGVGDVLKPTAVTELNLRQSFEQAVKRKAFIDGVREAGRPLTAKGWSPKPGDHVLVASGDAYVSGRVKSLRKGQAMVNVDGEGKEPRAFPKTELFQQPPVVFTPSVGTFACVRPSPGETIWQVIRIESASEGNVGISDAQGRRRTAELRDLIPLAK
jgi:hypothetical protein